MVKKHDKPSRDSKSGMNDDSDRPTSPKAKNGAQKYTTKSQPPRKDYGDRKDRPARPERDGDSGKRRERAWSDRPERPGQGSRAGSGDRFGKDRPGGNDRFRKDDRPGDRFAKTDRPGGSDRFRKDDRPGGGDRFKKDTRPGGGDRFRKDDRTGGDRFGKDQPGGNDRFRKDDRPGGDRFTKADRPGGGDRFRRDDRPGGGDRFNRDDRPAGGDRFSRNDRPGGDRFQRPDRSDRSDRPERADQPLRRDNQDRPDRHERSEFRDRQEFRKERPPFPARQDEDRPRRPQSVLRLMELDQALVDLVARRAALFARAASIRQPETGLETELWAIWQDRLMAEGLDPKLARQAFVLLNSLALDTAHSKIQTRPEGYGLAPKRAPVDLDMTGPSGLLETRLWTVLAAMTASPAVLTPVVLSDPLHDLLKTLSSAGAGFSWSGPTVTKPAGKIIALEDQSLFCGHDPLNFYLMVACGLAFPGRMRLTGGAELKLLDLRPAARILARLGARLSGVDHKTPGLPARLELGMLTDNRLELTAEDLDGTPHELFLGLALCSFAYPDGLTLTWPAGHPVAQAIRPAMGPLTLCGIDAELTDSGFRAVPADPRRVRLPETPPLSLDPLMSAFLLALPAANGGKARLSGRWPLDDGCADAALDLLRAAGLEVTTAPLEVTAEARAGLTDDKRELTLDTSACPHYFPLALALAVVRSAQGGRTALPAPGGPAGETQVATATELLGLLGASFALEDGPGGEQLAVEEGGLAPAGRPWLAPSAEYCLAMALAATAVPNLTLANHGLLSSVWPGFLGAYNRLPLVRDESREKKEKESAPGKGRRFRIGGDPGSGS